MGEARLLASEGERALDCYVEAVWETLDLERLESDLADLELLELFEPPESELLESELLELPESELLEEDSLLEVLDSLAALAASRSFLRLLALLPWSFL